MSETLRFFALQTTLIAVVLVLHTYIGLHVIRRTLIFSDLVLDQLAAFGAMLGIALGVEYGSAGSYFASFVAAGFGSVMLALLRPTNPRIPREAIVGILYAMALIASLLLGDKMSGGSTYISKTLSGSMLWVTWPLVAVTAAVYVVLLLFHYRFRDTFIALAENRIEVRKQKLWDFLFFSTQGIITVLIVPIAGVLLAYAFLMVPAAIAALFLKDWSRAVLLGWAAGLAACLIGLGASYHFNWSYGPTLVLSLGFFFLAAVLLRSLIPREA